MILHFLARFVFAIAHPTPAVREPLRITALELVGGVYVTSTVR